MVLTLVTLLECLRGRFEAGGSVAEPQPLHELEWGWR